MKKLFWIFILIFGLSQAGVYAQNITQQSYNQAKEVLDKAVAAYGGIDSLRSIENFSIRAEGDTVHRNQSRRAGMSERTPYIVNFTADLKNERYRQSVEGGYPGGFTWANQQAFDGKEVVFADMIRKTKVTRSAPVGWRNRLRWLPQMLLLNAAERSHRLRYLGKTTFNNRPHEVISYANEDAMQTSLYIDGETHLLSKLEWLGNDAFAGDAVTEIIFPAHKTAGNFKVPAGRIVKIADEITEEIRYADVSINKTLTDDEFKFNGDFRTSAPPPVNAPPVTKLAENVYTVLAGGYNVLFVNFKDYIFVMEAPGGDAVSRDAIAKIKETIPGKPIKYIAVTHFHDDHAGGVRTYIAEGATLVVAPGEKNFFEKVAKSKFTINPDTLARNPQPPKIETVEKGKRVFTDGAMTVELLDIGSGPHTDEMLVAYLPNEKILYQGDLLNNPLNGDAPIANDTSAHFAKWIESKKLAVERIVPVHGTPQTPDNLRKAVAEMPTTKNSAKN